ncbi:alpha/beta fold hydrolase [Salinimicrobium sediminilitoris]|uniref:alpha/beta fold hydrolase n=1 Tax=Salinimicrobium sediminilitoris TaxID=2876715 RepID=UPI001E40B70D|nr:alpha/beta hydrolase [Salinimicrobium sediminilitoris]MCC8359828.1 alpha/beta hydrolase [Salinimicrobium sediminilitoris]
MRKGILFSLLFITIASSTAQEKINELVKYSLPVKSINLNSETIAYAEEGSGEKTLLFIHGLSSTLDAWKKNINGLKDEYRCIAVDLPGYGKSSRNSTNYSLNDYGGMLQEFIKKKDLKKVILVGHSMGGQIAMHTVLNYPEDFKKLVLIAPAGIETFTEQEATLMKASYTPVMVVNTTNEQILANYKLNFFEFPEDAQQMVDDRIRIKSAQDFPAYAEVVVNNIHAMLDEPVIDRIKEINIPVLMIWGANDMLIPNKYLHPSESIENLIKLSEEKFSDLEVEVIDKAGHFVNFEKAEEVNSEIREFLKN